MEEFIIQPTAWYYIKYLGESNLFLGFTLAAYSTGTLVFSPFVGMLEVRFKGSSKIIILMAGLIKLSGNLIYSIPVNGYFPLFGRFLSGTGEGTYGILYGAITQCTTSKNRAKAFLYFEGLYAVGGICGPTIGSLLTFNVNILGWKIYAGNSPGVVLAITWILLLILTIFLPSDLAETKGQSEVASCDECGDEEDILAKCSYHDNACCPSSAVFCVYYIIFLLLCLFNLISVYTPLLAVHRIGLGLRQVKLIYANSSLFLFALLLATSILSDKLTEKICGLSLSVSAIVSISITFYFALKWNTIMPINSAYLLLISLIIVNATFINFALSSSLISKITPIDSAAFYQSLVFTMAHMGIIFSRIIAGATFAKIPMICTCLGFSIAWAFGVVWLAYEYNNLPS